jgi:hypothetical protein
MELLTHVSKTSLWSARFLMSWHTHIYTHVRTHRIEAMTVFSDQCQRLQIAVCLTSHLLASLLTPSP